MSDEVKTATPEGDEKPPEAATNTTEKPEVKPEAKEGDKKPDAWEPDARYKGLQRKLERERTAREDAEKRVGAQSPPPTSEDPWTNPVVRTMAERIAKDDPEGFKQLQTAAAVQTLQKENADLKAANETAAFEAQVAEVRSSNMTQLRGIVEDAAVDPESPLIDYGTDNDPLYTRMELVRASIKEAKAEAPRSDPKTREVADGSGHDLSGGQAAGSTSDKTYTQEDVEAVRKEYSLAPTEENMERLKIADEAFRKVVFAA